MLFLFHPIPRWDFHIFRIFAAIHHFSPIYWVALVSLHFISSCLRHVVIKNCSKLNCMNWGGLRWHNVHTKFHKQPSTGSKFGREREAHIHKRIAPATRTLTARLSHKPTLFLRKESRRMGESETVWASGSTGHRVFLKMSTDSHTLQYAYLRIRPQFYALLVWVFTFRKLHATFFFLSFPVVSLTTI
jgi:hypothetical protein